MLLIKGETPENTSLDILIDSSNVVPIDDLELVNTCDITPQMVVDFLKSLSKSTKSNFKYIYIQMLSISPLYAYINETNFENTNLEIINTDHFDDTLNDFYYTDNAKPFYHIFHYYCGIDGDKLIDINGLFTSEQFNNDKKVAIVQDYHFDETHSQIYSFASATTGEIVETKSRVLKPNTKSIIIGNEKYEIIKVMPDYEMGGERYDILIPLSAAPTDSKIVLTPFDDTTRCCFSLFFNESITKEQYEDIQNCLANTIGDKFYLKPLELTDTIDIYYYKTIVLISILITILAAINMSILYRYILEKRSSELAIYRICGCSKIKGILSYLLECIVIIAPLFALTEFLYHRLLVPKLIILFPNIDSVYSIKLYAIIWGLYISISIIVMLIMIWSTINKHSLVSMRNSSMSVGKISAMKVFEVMQLATVLSIIVLISSAVVSRYSLFVPFEQYLNRKGYMVTVSDMATYPEEFEQIINDADNIMNQFTNAFNEDIAFNGISYSDEFINAYTPPIKDGVWLDKADFTYIDSGYIPAVVTSCDGRYKVGDSFESTILMGYNKNDEPIYVIAQYRIIGVLQDKINIASYIQNNYTPKNHSDIYAVFSDSYEDYDYLLTRISDIYACYKAYGPLYGTQFVFCENLSREEYEDIGKRLNRKNGFTATPLSEIYDNSIDYIYEQMYTLFPIAICIFILTIISTISISAIYTKRQLRNYAIFYICGARWKTCAIKSLKNGTITCAASAILSALILIIGKTTLLKETVISFGVWQCAVCIGVIMLYLSLSMIMPLSIIGSAEPREVLKEE